MDRPLITADLLIHAIKSGQTKVTMAMIHPDDAKKVSIGHIRILLGGAEILQQHTVERGMLYISTKSVR